MSLTNLFGSSCSQWLLQCWSGSPRAFLVHGIPNGHSLWQGTNIGNTMNQKSSNLMIDIHMYCFFTQSWWGLCMGLVGPNVISFVYNQEVLGSKPCMLWMPHYVAIWPMVQNPKNGYYKIPTTPSTLPSHPWEQSNQSHPSSFVQVTSQHTIFHFGLCLLATSVASTMAPKCEHIGGPASTAISLQTQIFWQFVWISSNKIHSKINIFHTLALKIVK
jgi:hypothetical protein